jgi:biopolymer transport protein ExbD
MRIHDEEEDETPEVNMAPLIDCIFLLLIFFLLTSSIQKVDDDKQKAVQQLCVELPEAAAAATAPAQPEPLVIAVDAAGKFYVSNERVGIEKLHQILRAAAANKPKVRVEGDKRAAFEHIAHVLDLCQFEGLHDISVRTRDK